MRPPIVILFVLLCACGPKEQGAVKTAPPSSTVPTSKDTRPIGTATMDAKGTIKLMLRAEGPGGIVGDALIVYPKGHPRYEETLRHLGGLKPGESKPVPPWPSK